MNKSFISHLTHPEKTYEKLLYLVFSGVLTGCCITFPTLSGEIVSWFSLVPALCVLFESQKSREKYRRVWECGFLFFMSEYIVIYHWFLSMYPLEFTGLSKGAALCVVLLGWLGLSALASAAGGLFCLALVFVCRHIKTDSDIPAILLAPAFYSCFEWFETLGWMGVPWNRLGLSQLGADISPTLMSSAFFGSYFTTFIMLLFASLIAAGLRNGKERCIAALLLAAANLLYGFSAIALNNADASETVRVAAIQGNISSAEKWDTDKRTFTLEKYKSLTEEAANEGAEIILWPETAITYVIKDGSDCDIQLRALAAECGCLLCVGCFEEENGSNKNVIRFYLPDGSVYPESYSKRHLVPFGEYVPWKNFFMTVVPPLAKLTMIDKGLAAGSDSSLAEYAGINIGCLICFDSIYETLCAESCRDGADMMLLSTNDSWFGTSAALNMHNNQARLRAIENNICILRAANTGISSAIDGNGTVICRTEAATDGYIIADIQIGGGSFYSSTGNIFVFICLTSVILSIIYAAFDVIKKKRG